MSARGLPAVQVRAANWVAALGQGLQELDRAENVQRLACEMLQNGTVIARDITSGIGYVVQEVDADDFEYESMSGETIEAVEDLDLIEVPADDDETDIEELEDGVVEIEVDLDDLVEIEADDALEIIDRAETRHAACQAALSYARELVPAESGAVILEEKGYLRFIAVAGPHARTLVGVRLPLGTGVAGFSMQRQRTVVLVDATQDPRHCGEVDALTGYRTQQIAVLPVVHGDKALGVLELMNLPDGQRFTNQDVENLERVAEALAARLER